MWMSTEPADATAVEPLLVLTRQAPEHWPTVIVPDMARRSTDAASPTLMEPLMVVARTAPSGPVSRSEPERAPTITDDPSGQRTVMECDRRRGTTSNAPSLARWTSAWPSV